MRTKYYYITEPELISDFSAWTKVKDTAGKVKSAVGTLGTKVLGGDTAQGIPQAGLLDRTLAFGTLASIPIGIGSMIIPSADTRAVQAMRNEDKFREARGLSQLAATPQMIAEKAQEAKNFVTNSMNNTRVTTPNTNMILPRELPPNSLR